MAERKRTQLVIVLGEGAVGAKRRAVLDKEAAQAGMPVSVWARQMLMTAAGVTGEEKVTREEFNALSMRVQELEGGIGD